MLIYPDRCENFQRESNAQPAGLCVMEEAGFMLAFYRISDRRAMMPAATSGLFMV